MGGARIDVNQIRKVIAAQTRTFTIEDIAREGNISIPSVYRILEDMKGAGSIVIDHKVGRKIHYAVSATGSKDGVIKPNITLLSPAERFAHVGMLVDMVAQGISPSVLVTGVSGIGKTYLVTKRLEANGFEEDDGYIMVKGHSTPMGLYRSLHDHRDQRIVFDDCDGVFKEPKAIGLLKAALDSYDTRKISWNSERLPDDLESPFVFTGQIIFVSNLLASQIDEAVKSRTFVVDLQMSRKEIGEYIYTILDNIHEQLDRKEMEVVLRTITERCDYFEQYNIRTFLKACRIYRHAKINGHDWGKSLSVMV